MPDAWDFTQKPQRAGPIPQVPILTYLLLALSVLMTAAYLIPGGEEGGLWDRIGHFGLAESPGAAPWGLLTKIFIHGSPIHLLFNVIWLYQLGRILESTLSPLVYLAFIVGAAAVGGGCEVLISGQTGTGLSGVVYAMFALMWAGRGLYPAWAAVATRNNLRYFILWGLFCVGATLLHFLNVASGAHGGGFLFGLSIGFLFFVPRRRWVWAAPLVLLVGVTIFSAIRLHSNYL